MHTRRFGRPASENAVQKSYYKGQIVAKEPSCVLTAVMLMAMCVMRCRWLRSESVAHVSRCDVSRPRSGRDSVKRRVEDADRGTLCVFRFADK